MGYGIFRRAPYVGKPKRKALPPQLFPRSAFDAPQPKARKAIWPFFRRKPRKTKPKPLFPQLTVVSSPPLHVKRPLWNVYRRRSPPIYRKPRLKAALFTTTRFDAPPLAKKKPGWRLYRKPPFRKLARKVLNLALFLIAPIVGTRIVDWSPAPRWNAKTNRAKRTAGIFFAILPTTPATTGSGNDPKKKKRGLVGGKYVFFDTPEELAQLRRTYRESQKPKPQEVPVDAPLVETPPVVETPAVSVEPKYIGDFAQYVTPPAHEPTPLPKPSEPPLPKMKDVDPKDEDGALWLLLDE